MRGGRISKVSRAGVVTTLVDALPSSQTSPALGSLVSGVSSVAFIGHRLYELLSGAGCSHGVPTVPNGVIKVSRGGTWSVVANLSAFQAAHPVAKPDPEDFEPDGTWYSMISIGGALEMSTTAGSPTPGTGAIVRVKPHGPAQTVASGLTFPTGMTVSPDGAFYVSNRGFGFGAGDGQVLRIQI